MKLNSVDPKLNALQLGIVESDRVHAKDISKLSVACSSLFAEAGEVHPPDAVV